MSRTFFTPRMFLIAGGAVLLLLGIVGYLNIFTKASSPAFWLDSGENIAHVALGIIALAAVYVPGLNDILRPYYRWIVILVGIIALFFGLYGFIASGPADANTFGLANLETSDNILHLVVAAWAFASAWTQRTAETV
jgi:hypothetical protein